MKVQEIKEIAVKLGIKPGRMKKADLVRAVQRGEGNEDCYGSERAANCGQLECLWRKDCLKQAAA